MNMASAHISNAIMLEALHDAPELEAMAGADHFARNAHGRDSPLCRGAQLACLFQYIMSQTL